MKKVSSLKKMTKSSQMELEQYKENQIIKRRKRAPKVYKNQQDLNLDFLDTVLVNKQLWKENWLDGYQYYMLLKNQHRLDQKHFPLLSSHPTWIYEKPINGHLYFLKEVDLEKDGPFKLGFPRTSSLNKKSWKWKRNNFPTKLPKNDPKIVYICATTEGAEQDENGKLIQKRFRMHIAKIIDLYNKELLKEQNSQGLVVCQMLEIEFGKTKEGKKYIPKPISQIIKKENCYNQKKKLQIEDVNTMEIETDNYSFSSCGKNECKSKNYENFACDNIEIESNIPLNNIEQEQPQSIKLGNQIDHISSTAEKCTAAISIENDKFFEKISPSKDQFLIPSSQFLESQNRSNGHSYQNQNYLHYQTKENSNDPFIYLKNSMFSSQKNVQALKNAYISQSIKSMSCQESLSSNKVSSSLQKVIKFNKKTSPVKKRLFQNYENNQLYQYQDIFSYSNTQNGSNSPQNFNEQIQNNFNIFNTQADFSHQNKNSSNSSIDDYCYGNNNNFVKTFNDYLSENYEQNNNTNNNHNNDQELQSLIESQKSPLRAKMINKKNDQNQRKDDKEDLDNIQNNQKQTPAIQSNSSNKENAQVQVQGQKIWIQTKNQRESQDNQGDEFSVLVQPLVFKQCKKNKDEYYAIIF